MNMKKVISFLLTCSVIFSSASIIPVMADEGTETRKLISLDFNDENDRLKTPNGSASVNGTLTYATGKDNTDCAYFDGKGTGWIDLKDDKGRGLLAGKNNITISFSSKTDAAPSWWLYAAPNAAVPVYQQEKYLGLLDQKNSFKIERYKNEGVRANTVTSSYTQGAWKDIVVSINGTTSELYIDGRFAGSKNYDYSLSDILGDNPIAYIGKATWGSGEYASGCLDDFMIYDFDIIPNLGDTSAVSEDIALPSGGDGYTIEWKSSDAGIVSDDGKITRPDMGKSKATLTASIKFDDKVLTRDYDVYVTGSEYYDYKINISNDKGVDIQDNMYGLFFEDINYAADGGLYAEMIENRSFEAMKSNGSGGTSFDGMYGWSVYPSGTTEGLSVKTENALNANNPHYLTAAAGTSIKNQAYDGVYMEEGKTYNISAYIRTPTVTDESKPVEVKIYSGSEAAGECTLAKNVSNEWIKYETSFTPSKTVRNADFVISSQASIDIDMISCIPDDAVKGVFRKDLAEKLKALNPGFLRFPGGCIIEGYNLANRYNWKDSVGPSEERKQNWSRWSCHTNSGLDGGFKHYNQTYGIGFYEYFELCEYLGCDPVPVVNVGMACEFQSNETVPVYENDGTTYTEEFYRYIQDALDLIEFANGSETTAWGKVRHDMGHSEPFNLTMIGIGNEQWAKSGNQWYDRYEAFEKEIHKVYPDMKLIATSGPSASGTDFTNAWAWIRKNKKTNDSFTYAVDEHYYMSPEWFLENDTRYDNYDRSTKVFAGEYAAHTTLAGAGEKKNNLESAVAEAAFMTGLERNADVVYMASYAPLFARLDYTQWAPDMVWFDDSSSYASPTYYVQKMYMNNSGDYTLKSTVTDSYENKVYQSVSYDEETRDIIIKIANPSQASKRCGISVDKSFKLTGSVDTETLTGNSLTDVNSIDNPDNIAPVNIAIDYAVTDNTLSYTMQPLSFTVMRVHTEKSEAQNVEISSFTKKGNTLSYELKSDAAGDTDVYAAVYDSSGRLVHVDKNKTSGEIKASEEGEYTLKVMVWRENSMVPVTKAVEKKAEEVITQKDMAAYLFVHFVGTEGSASDEQIYFSVSKDGTNWQTLNECQPVLTSDVGEKGVRDPHIIRSPEGDKFFLIATDLSIYNRRGDPNKWGTCQTSGSQSIVIWESADLVNWSEARLVKTAPDNAGCTWAPESVYDDASGRYMVFWASKTAADNYKTQRIYRSYTTDFVTFTEPEIYMDGGSVSNIDTTFLKDDGVYYRFTKNESKSSIIMEKSESLDGDFEAVETYSINGTAGNTVTGYEGPTAYKLNGEDKWCLLLDYYSKSQGYKPFVTNDIGQGVFTSAQDFNFDTKYRHGTVMPITEEEYDALVKAYTTAEEEESGDLVFSLNFDDETVNPSLGEATAHGTITYSDGHKGKAAVLDGTDYIELISDKNGKNPLSGLESFTVSFAAKADAQSWWLYAAPNTAAQTYKSEKYIGALDKDSKLICERYNSSSVDRPAAAQGSFTGGEWNYFTIVHRKKSVTLYINGKQASKVSTIVSLPELLGESPVIYLGKANWNTGEYSNGMIDEFKIYNYALSDEETAADYAETFGK